MKKRKVSEDIVGILEEKLKKKNETVSSFV